MALAVLQDLFTVLICSSKQKSAVALLALPAGQDIRGNLGVGVSDVRGVIDVKNRRRDIKRLIS